jgi:hypothetical protein
MELQPMFSTTRSSFAMAIALALVATASPAIAQSKGGGKIVCWKDKAGKVVGCGDSVPPEYQTSATKELDRRGVTRKTTDSADEVAKHRARDEELARQKAEEQKKLAEQKRQDSALINTFANEKEIDAKRDRELQQIDLQQSQLQTAFKGATDRHNALKARSDAAEKSKKPVPDIQKDDLARAAADKEKLENSIAAKEKEKQEVRQRYAEYRKRFAELKGTSQSPAAPAPKPGTAKQ